MNHQPLHSYPPQRQTQPLQQQQQFQFQHQHQQYHSPQLHPSSHHRQHSRTVPSLIERLPQELQRLVFSHLDYQTLIYLSTMNRYFHQTINPQRMADPADKAQFVMRAAKDFAQHRPSEKGHDYKPGNFECYICFRVRSPEHFDMLQPQSIYVDAHGHAIRDREPDSRSDRLVMLRRFCISCGRDGTSGSAGAGKSGPSLAACVVPTVKETALFDRGGSWAWTRTGTRKGSIVTQDGNGHKEKPCIAGVNGGDKGVIGA
ncbi:hypothetical protein Trihar35433_8075 [Trichoderma harzianum]|nr:hypothetical protein Trihar35433_8075 [Trichoderma harzianum]